MTRGSIFVEDAQILAHDAYPGEQFTLRLRSPKVAAAATPGSFAHVQCDPSLPMRRPLSLMRANAKAGWIELLYKRLGRGSALLSQKPVGADLSILGPIGVGFRPDIERPRALLIGGGVGIPPMVFLAEVLRREPVYKTLVVMGSEVAFPFTPVPSKIMVSAMPEGVIGAMPLLDDWGIASRLASLQDFAGCFDGYVTSLARVWLDALTKDQLGQVTVYACGPTPMLKATVDLARDYELPCQVCLEEYMACAVGGCAGCVVEVTTTDGPAMKRVCVDGPVFDAALLPW